MASNFYLVGLGLLMKGVTFTPEEQALLQLLCRHAERGDDQYLAALERIHSDLTLSRILEGLKQTLRVLGKASTLQAHYDRAA